MRLREIKHEISNIERSVYCKMRKNKCTADGVQQTVLPSYTGGMSGGALASFLLLSGAGTPMLDELRVWSVHLCRVQTKIMNRIMSTK